MQKGSHAEILRAKRAEFILKTSASAFAISVTMFAARPATAQDVPAPPSSEVQPVPSSPAQQPPAAAPLQAIAPTEAQAPPAAAYDTQDIVVTAQRREEKLSRVPISVAAFNAQTLQTKVITSEQDVGQLVPGLQVKNGQTSNQLSYSIRGQTLDPFSGTSPAVLTYLNEVPYSPYNTATDFFDLGSIQALKGPQGTLFGRNATGGAVLYTTPMPGDDFAGNLIVRGGQRNQVQVTGAVDLPIIKDVLLVRVAGDYTKEDGYVRNLFNGQTLGDKDNKSGRLTVVFKPTDRIRNTTLAQYSKFGGTEGSGNLYNYYTAPDGNGQQFINNGKTSVPNTTGVPLTSTLDTVYNVFSGLLFNKSGNNLGDSNLTPGPAIGPGRFPGGVEGYAQFSRANPYSAYLQFKQPHNAHSTFVSNTTEFDATDTMKIKNIFGYMDSYSRITSNLAGGPFGALYLFNEPNNPTGLSGCGDGACGGQTFRAKQFSEEVQAQGTAFDNRLNYTIGGFYSHVTHHDVIPIHVGSEIDPNAGAAAAFGLPADIDYTYATKDISKAVYAQIDYKLTDRLTATGGFRYTWENVSLQQSEGSIFALTGASPLGVVQKKHLSAPAWTFNLAYQLNPQNMFYFAQRGSFRSGNFNGTVVPVNNANFFKNEYAHDFELGYKFNGRVADLPLQFNAAIYEELVKNAQHAVYAVVGGAPAGFTLNVPRARTRGAEVDTAIRLARWLSLTGTGAYTDAKYTRGRVGVARLTGTPGDFIDFNSYPDTPKWAGTLGADLSLPVDESVGQIVLHSEVYAQTHTFFSSNDGSVTPGTRLKGYTTINMRLSWNNILGTKFSAGVYVKNLADKLYYVSGYALGAAGGYNTGYPGEPRTVAGEVSVKF